MQAEDVLQGVTISDSVADSADEVFIQPDSFKRGVKRTFEFLKVINDAEEVPRKVQKLDSRFATRSHRR